MARRSIVNKGYPLPPIPSIIHQMWLPNWLQVPAAVRCTRAEWCRLNPTWEYKFWGYREVNDLVQRRYPKLRKLWGKLANERLIKMADFARLVVLHHFGGLYSDMDLMPVKEIGCGSATGKFVVATEWTPDNSSLRFCNGFLGSIPEQDAWMELLLSCEDRLHGPVLGFLGPKVISQKLRGLELHVLPWRHILSVDQEPIALTRNLENRSWGEAVAGKKWFDCS